MQPLRKYLLGLFILIIMCSFGSSAALAQEGGSNAHTDATQQQEFSPIFEASESKRSMPSGALPGFPNQPSFFANPMMTHEMMGLVDLAKIKSKWSEVNVRSWSNEEDQENVELRSRIIRSYFDPSEEMKITFVQPKKDIFDVNLIGVLQANVTEEEVPMEAVFSVLGQKALEEGANLMYPMNEGAKRVLTASGWGAALGYSHVVMGGGSERTAGVGTVGLGYSEGQSDYKHKPFARVAIYKVKEKYYDELPVFPENGGDKAKEQLQKQNQQLKQQLKQMQQTIQQYQQQQEASQ